MCGKTYEDGTYILFVLMHSRLPKGSTYSTLAVHPTSAQYPLRNRLYRVQVVLSLLSRHWLLSLFPDLLYLTRVNLSTSAASAVEKIQFEKKKNVTDAL